MDVGFPSGFPTQRILFVRQNSDDIPQPSKPFLLLLQTISVDLEIVITAQEKISTSFYFCRAKQGQITTKHTTWAQELKELSKKIQSCNELIRQLQQQIPLLEDTRIIHTHWPELLRLKQTAYFTQEKNKDLTLLLGSPKHRETLEFYKKMIKSTEESYTEPSQLNSLITETNTKKELTLASDELKYCDPKLYQSIENLYEKTLFFINHAKTMGPNTWNSDFGIAPQLYSAPDHDTNSSSEETVDQITAQFSEMSVSQEEDSALQTSYPTPLPKSPDQTLLATQKNCFTACKKIPLCDLYRFRKNVIALSIRYPKTYTFLEKIEKIAKFLQDISINVEKSTSEIWRKSISFPVEAPSHYEGLLNYAKTKLDKIDIYSKPFSSEIHAFIHYSNGLRTWIEEIEESINYLSKILSPEWAGIRQAHGQFLHYFQEKAIVNPEISPLEKSLQEVKNFYKLIKAGKPLFAEAPKTNSFTDQLRAQIIDCMRACISAEGVQVLALTNDEKSLLNTLTISDVPIREYPSLEDIHMKLKSLIIKKITHFLYFTELSCDLELDLAILAIEQIRKKYPIKRDNTFESIYELYIKKAEIKEDLFLLGTSKQIFYLLGTAKKLPQNSHLKAYICYSWCRQLMQPLTTFKRDEISLLRSTHFASLAEENLVNLHEQYKFPEYCISPTADNRFLYELLLDSLWGEKEKQSKAISIFFELLQPKNQNLLDLIARDPYIKILVEKCLLITFSERIYPLSPLGETLLRSALIDYLKDPTLWRSLHGILFMEKTLFTFLFNYPQIITKNFFPERCTPKRNSYYDKWYTVLEAYTTFEDLKKSASSIETEYRSLISTVKKIKIASEGIEDSFYVELFSKCFCKMKKDFQVIFKTKY